MKTSKLALLTITFSALLFANGPSDTSWAQDQNSLTFDGSTAARIVETPAEDITLTNSCIESGKEKIYCVCATKIFKNEMTLHQYRGAAALHQMSGTESVPITLSGYTEDDIASIKALTINLHSEKQFRTRCNLAEIYFASATEG